MPDWTPEWTLYGVTFTVRVLAAIILPFAWRLWWKRKGQKWLTDKYIKSFSTEAKDANPHALKSTSQLYAKMIYWLSWIGIGIIMLLLSGILKGFGDPTSRSIWISSGFLTAFTIVVGSSAVKESISGWRVAANKYGGTGDYQKLHHHHDIGVHHKVWHNLVDIYSTLFLTRRFTDLVIENSELRHYAIENVDRNEFFHAVHQFPIKKSTRAAALKIPKKILNESGSEDETEEWKQYQSINALLAATDVDDRKRITDVMKDLPDDDWDKIRNPSVTFLGNGMAELRLPVRGWQDEDDIIHEIINTGLLDEFYDGDTLQIPTRSDINAPRKQQPGPQPA